MNLLNHHQLVRADRVWVAIKNGQDPPTFGRSGIHTVERAVPEDHEVPHGGSYADPPAGFRAVPATKPQPCTPQKLQNTPTHTALRCAPR